MRWERMKDPGPVLGCPFGDWAGRSEGALDAHMRSWHEEQPGECIRNSGPAVQVESTSRRWCVVHGSPEAPEGGICGALMASTVPVLVCRFEGDENGSTREDRP